MVALKRLWAGLCCSVLLALGLFGMQALAGEGNVDSDPSAADVEGDDDARSQAADKGRQAAESLRRGLGRAMAETPALTPDQRRAGRRAFEGVAEVLQSPRCMNCHPAGNRPLQTDESTPHALAISRTSTESGLECATCHREQNSEAWGIEGGPPGAPHWGLPPEDMPMVFEGRTPRELCEQLKDPQRSGHDDLQEFIEHITHDALVLWGWEPGGDRSTPPLSHAEFVEQARIWVEAGGVCPE